MKRLTRRRSRRHLIWHLFLIWQVLYEEADAPEVTTLELVFGVWAIGNAVDQIHQAAVARRNNIHVAVPFAKLLNFADRLLMLALFFRITSVWVPHISGYRTTELRKFSYIAYQLLLAYDIVLISLRTIVFRAIVKV